jgi:hypothetical protein
MPHERFGSSKGLTYSYGIITVGLESVENFVMPSRPRTTPAADRYTQRFAELRRQLQDLGYFCKGTILERRMKCGQPNCACHQNPSKRHGPYWEWTYKRQGKTVNVKLTPEAGPIYQVASQQYHKLKSLLNRLERLSHKALAGQAKEAKAQHTV